MSDHTTELYCIIDDLLKAIGHIEDVQRAMSDTQVLTTALVSAQLRKRIETVFSQITSLFPKHIHAITLRCGRWLRLMTNYLKPAKP